MPTLQDAAKKLEKRYGEGRVLHGLSALKDLKKSMWDFPRLPTGIFAVDYCLGGGVPFNIMSQFYGPPASCKSTTAYLLARSLSRFCMNPGCFRPLALCRCTTPLIQKTFFCQVEGTVLDELWFDTLGYDADRHAVIAFPDYAEQACEMIEAAVRSDDCALVVVDSVGAMLPRAELEGSYEDSFVGSQARLLTRLSKRLSNILVGELRRGHFVAVVLINQIRASIGGSFYGPTETTAGGYALRHGIRLSVRFASLSAQGSAEKDSDGMRYILRASASLASSSSKQQVFIMGAKAEFKISISESSGYSPGVVMDWGVVLKKLKELELLQQTSAGYTIPGLNDLTFQRQADIEELFLTRRDGLDDAIRFLVISRAKDLAIQELRNAGSQILKVGDGSRGMLEETDREGGEDGIVEVPAM